MILLISKNVENIEGRKKYLISKNVENIEGRKKYYLAKVEEEAPDSGAEQEVDYNYDTYKPEDYKSDEADYNSEKEPKPTKVTRPQGGSTTPMPDKDDKDELFVTTVVNCGGHTAVSCDRCAQGTG